jgi:hypothetical protein
MVITSFGLVSIDLGQQPHKAHKILGGLARFRFSQSRSAQVTELRSQVIVWQ